MTDDRLNFLAAHTYQNFLKEAASSTDISVYGPLILPLLKKLYTHSLITQIADTQNLKSPYGKIATLHGVYSGNSDSANNNSHPDNSYIIVLDTTSGLTVGSIVTIGTGTFTILYIEDTKLLVAATIGTTYVPKATDTFSGKTISYATSNRAAIKKLFRAYSGNIINGKHVGIPYGTDDNSNVKFVSFETRTIPVQTESRKIKARFSQEQLQDYKAIYGEDGIKLAAEFIAHDIQQEIDKEFISYLKFISKLITSAPLTLGKSIAAAPSGALQDITSDIVVNIFSAAEQIVKDTKRNRTIFVLADPITCGFLQVNPFVARAEFTEKNPYKVGTVGNYPLYQDLFAEPGEYYCIVGYLGVDGGGDAGIIYSPYTSTIHTATDVNFKENLMCMERYAITRHPQDVGNVTPSLPWDSSNASNSDFFKMFLIDYTTTTNTPIVNFSDTTLNNWYL